MERNNSVLLLFQKEKLSDEWINEHFKKIIDELKRRTYLYNYRIRRPRHVRPFLEARGRVLKNKVLAHDILNKQASSAYPTLAFHSQSLKVFEVHISVFIALISPFLKGKIIV